MTLTELVEPWLREKWTGLTFERNSVGELIAYNKERWLLKVKSNSIELSMRAGAAICVCCSDRYEIMAADPNLFQRLEAELDADSKRNAL
jgi:hypothetical protein